MNPWADSDLRIRRIPDPFFRLPDVSQTPPPNLKPQSQTPIQSLTPMPDPSVSRSRNPVSGFIQLLKIRLNEIEDLRHNISDILSNKGD